MEEEEVRKIEDEREKKEVRYREEKKNIEEEKEIIGDIIIKNDEL